MNHANRASGWTSVGMHVDVAKAHERWSADGSFHAGVADEDGPDCVNVNRGWRQWKVLRNRA